MPIAKLDRRIFLLSGEALRPWLGGLITNNLGAPLTFAALLTPQGKIIADFFITQDGDDMLIDTAPKFADNLLKRLRIYKLREKITLTEVTDKTHLYALWSGSGDLGHADPRSKALGQRLLTTDIIETSASAEAYNAERLALSIPDSHYDFETETMFPADANMDLLSGVDFKKGCFIGQEVVSRMKRKTTVRKRMRAVKSAAVLTLGPISCAGRIVGECLYTSGSLGMALMRLDRLSEATAPPMNGGAIIEILTPDYS
jgi:folate-binding protein YgfZ